MNCSYNYNGWFVGLECSQCIVDNLSSLHDISVVVIQLEQPVIVVNNHLYLDRQL